MTHYQLPGEFAPLTPPKFAQVCKSLAEATCFWLRYGVAIGGWTDTLKAMATEMERPFIHGYWLTVKDKHDPKSPVRKVGAVFEISKPKVLTYLLAPILSGGQQVIGKRAKYEIHEMQVDIAFVKEGSKFIVRFNKLSLANEWLDRCRTDPACRKLLKLDYPVPKSMEEILKRAGVSNI